MELGIDPLRSGPYDLVVSTVECGVCKLTFYVKPSHLRKGWGKYCSTICRSKAQFNGKLVDCEICDKKVYRSFGTINKSKSGLFFCSKSCQTLWRNNTYKEENHVNWVDGKYAYRSILIRSSKPSCCGLCGNTDKRVLSAHHIDHKRTNNKLENLGWLCLNCHYLVHHDRDLDKKMRKLGS